MKTIGFAKVSTSAEEARELGFLAPTDRVILNREHLLAEAKREVLELAEAGYRPPVTTGNVYAAGRDHYASVKIEIYSMLQAGFISEHDALIADKLGYVLAGGDLSEPAWMDEQYFLDLERDAVSEPGQHAQDPGSHHAHVAERQAVAKLIEGRSNINADKRDCLSATRSKN